MSEKIDLNQYEERLFEIVKENPGINDVKAAALADLPKETTSKYLGRLQDYGLIELQRLQQNEKAWFVSTKIFPSFDTLRKKVMEDYEIMESKIKKSLKFVENRPHKEVISVYRSAYKKVFAFRDFVIFILTTNGFRKHPKHWTDLQKRIDEFLNELAKGVDGDIAIHVMADLEQRDSEALDEINYFLKFQKSEHSKLEESRKSLKE
ncbi:MAG: hypothetical protein NPMRTH1_820006 [Nitrosopumilales archaeon]|nr:MAG: hypothetical protein NPMRTH1_820006 [Nitrosopumilales archaeon]